MQKIKVGGEWLIEEVKIKQGIAKVFLASLHFRDTIYYTGKF